MPVFATPEIPHWDFPRNPASAALLVAFGMQHGVTRDELLAGSGLSESDLADSDQTITARQELTVASNLIRLLGDPPGMGLEVGAQYHASTFGIFGFACLTSPTLGDAVRFAMRYYELSYGFCLPTVTVTDDTATLHLELPDLSGPIAEFLLQRDLSSMAAVMADILAAPLPLNALTFAFPSRGSMPFLDILQVTPEFDAPETTAKFPAELLSRPLPQASAMTVAMCESQCEDLLMRRRSRSGVARLVREQLVKLDGGPHTINSVARSLTMSERTLRRRLNDESTSFRQLTDEVNRTLAEELLGTGALSVDDVAIRLGYSEASSFIAAFKRWTGITPARFVRESARKRSA